MGLKIFWVQKKFLGPEKNFGLKKKLWNKCVSQKDVIQTKMLVKKESGPRIFRVQKNLLFKKIYDWEKFWV